MVYAISSRNKVVRVDVTNRTMPVRSIRPSLSRRPLNDREVVRRACCFRAAKFRVADVWPNACPTNVVGPPAAPVRERRGFAARPRRSRPPGAEACVRCRTRTATHAPERADRRRRPGIPRGRAYVGTSDAAPVLRQVNNARARPAIRQVLEASARSGARAPSAGRGLLRIGARTRHASPTMTGNAVTGNESRAHTPDRRS